MALAQRSDIAYAKGAGPAYGLAFLFLFPVIPLTLFHIKKTNDRLLEEGRDPASDETRTRLRRWGRLHASRTLLSGAAFAILQVARTL